jgi:hypothetical protein
MNLRTIILGLVLMTSAQAFAKYENFEILNVLQFVSDDGQIATSFDCNISEVQKMSAEQHCQVMMMIYSEEAVDMESPADTKSSYSKKTPDEARTLAKYFCDEVASETKILARPDLLPGRKALLKQEISKNERYCGCQKVAKPSVCLASAVPQWVSRKNFCSVSTMTLKMLMERQKDGGWKGKVDGPSDVCGLDPKVEIKSGGSSFGIEYAILEWLPKIGGNDTPYCRVLNRSLQLRNLRQAAFKPACDEVELTPVR